MMTPTSKILLLFSAVDWSRYSRRSMVSALARAAGNYGIRVVVFNRPLGLLTAAITRPGRITDLFGSPVLEQAGDNLFLYHPKYFVHDEIANRFSFLEPLNLNALRNSYRHLRKRLDINDPSPIIWYNYPHQGYVTGLFADSFCIFELYDNLSNFEGRESAYVNRLEDKYRPRVDLLLTTSQNLLSRHGPDYKRTYLFGNGLDSQTLDRLLHQKTNIWQPLIKIAQPRIGYAGMISERLDWDLIGSLALLQPDWNYIFVGPVSSRKILRKLEGIKNVQFFEPVSPSEIPTVLKSFDIGILPYRDNPFFHALNPLKFYEMAAAGLPIVSSNIDELRSYPRELIRVVPNRPDIWRDAIAEALEFRKSRTHSPGPEIAAEHTWDKMTAKLMEKLAGEWLPRSQKF